jgi:hypothetical protein
MPKETFHRPVRGGKGGGGDVKPPTDLTVVATQPARSVVEEGEHIVRVDEATMTHGRKPGNICAALSLYDIEADVPILMHPIWIGGPNADKGTLAGRNLAHIVELLRAAGVPAEQAKVVNNATLALLKGKPFSVELGIQEPRGDYGRSNVINEVYGLAVIEGDPGAENSPAESDPKQAAAD